MAEKETDEINKAGDEKEKKPSDRGADSRRRLLKKLIAGSGAVVAGKSVSGEWTKPVVDSVLLPAHAQTTGEVGQLIGTVFLADDAPGGQDTGMGPGTTNLAPTYYDDSADVHFRAQVIPPAAVPITVDVAITGDTDAGGDYSPLAFDFNNDATTNAATGLADIDATMTDFGDSDGVGWNAITVTFKSPGYANSVVVLNFGT